MRTTLFLCVVAFAGIASVYSQGVDVGDGPRKAGTPYPTKYPFEDADIGVDYFEDYQKILPDNTPSFTYDDDDKGNYVGLVQRADTWYGIPGYHPDPLPEMFHWLNTRVNEYFIIHFIGRPSPITFIPAVMNCTNRAVGVFDEAVVTGTLDGETVCEDKKTCCPEMMGTLLFQEITGSEEDQLAADSKQGFCAPIHPQAYCLLMYSAQRNCMEIYLSPDERSAVFPCHDGIVLWLMTCPYYRENGVTGFLERWEPLGYLSTLTAFQSIVAWGANVHNDRVCQPYSYYYPDGVGESTTTSSASRVGALSALFSVVAIFAQ